MIIIQTPLRVSLFGGGTDIPEYFQVHGGCVLSAAIDKYIFVTIKKRFDDLLRVGYTKTELVEDVEEIEHELIRESFRMTGISSGVEITTMGDIPSVGSGLGSSATVTVGSLHAMYTYLGNPPTPEQLAKEACSIEIDILKRPSGVQDQYIAAYGGMRWMEFCQEGTITVQTVEIDDRVRRALDERLLLFYTGVTRSSSTILVEQKKNMSDRVGVLSELKDIAREAHEAISRGELDELGRLLDISWKLKTRLAAPISNPSIDNLYETARRAGALGGKIAGAGGGGFMLLYCPEGRRQSLRDALSGVRELPFGFERDGSKVIFNYRR